MTKAPPIDETFAALGDPTRAAILGRLSRGPASVTELAEPFAMSLRGVLKHVKVLEDAGVVRTVKTGRVRRCEIIRTPSTTPPSGSSSYGGGGSAASTGSRATQRPSSCDDRRN